MRSRRVRSRLGARLRRRGGSRCWRLLVYRLVDGATAPSPARLALSEASGSKPIGPLLTAASADVHPLGIEPRTPRVRAGCAIRLRQRCVPRPWCGKWWGTTTTTAAVHEAVTGNRSKEPGASRRSRTATARRRLGYSQVSSATCSADAGKVRPGVTAPPTRPEAGPGEGQASGHGRCPGRPGRTAEPAGRPVRKNFFSSTVQFSSTPKGSRPPRRTGGPGMGGRVRTCDLRFWRPTHHQLCYAHMARAGYRAALFSSGPRQHHVRHRRRCPADMKKAAWGTSPRSGLVAGPPPSGGAMRSGSVPLRAHVGAIKDDRRQGRPGLGRGEVATLEIRHESHGCHLLRCGAVRPGP